MLLVSAVPSRFEVRSVVLIVEGPLGDIKRTPHKSFELQTGVVGGRITRPQAAASRPGFVVGTQGRTHTAPCSRQHFSSQSARLVCNATESTAPGTSSLDKLRNVHRLAVAHRTGDGSCDIPVLYSVLQEADVEDMSEDDKEQWQDGLQQLKDIGMDDTQAEKSLKRGFGWSSQAYWWKQKVKEVPKPGEVMTQHVWLMLYLSTTRYP